MIKKINKYINLSIIMSILLALLGIIIFIFPKTTLNIFSYTIAIIALISGIYLIVLEIRTRNNLITIGSSLFGVLFLTFGLIIFAHPKAFSFIIPITLGIWFIVSGASKFRFASFLRKDNFSIWILTLIITILSIVCGLIFILNPMESSKIITSSFGIIMIIYSISDICEMIIFKKNVKKIEKVLKEKIKVID